MKARFDIMSYAWRWIIGSCIVMIASVLLFAAYFRPSIQFTGGIQIRVASLVDSEVLTSINQIDGINQVTMSEDVINEDVSHFTILIQTQTQDDKVLTDLSQQAQQVLINNGVIDDNSQLLETSIVGPSIGAYLTRSARNTILWWLLLMTGYMIFSFSAIRQHIQPQILAIITIFTMLFDVLVPMWLYWLRMAFDWTAQVDIIFVIALLTTMWYSINDTIIIFDRIRENLINMKSKNTNLKQLFEDSLWQTMRRSLGTSLSTFIVVVAMYLLGTGDLARFAFTMWTGVLAGSFSSIFLAAPLAYLLITHMTKKQA